MGRKAKLNFLKPYAKTLPVTTLIGIVVFFAIVQALGVPLWWIFSGLLPLNVVQVQSYFRISIYPANPIVLDELETLTARNLTDNSPVSGANVTIIKDGSTIFRTTTNSSGMTTFHFAGTPTIIRVEKDGFRPEMRVIPQIPEPWVITTGLTIALDVMAILVSAIVPIWLANKRKSRSRTIERRVKQSKPRRS